MYLSELVVFIIYLLIIFVFGVYFALKPKNTNEKAYFIGNRQMGAWVTALSAGAADMSAWVLMGLPTAVYALGLRELWIPIGLAAGYILAWVLEAPRLRRFSILAGDAITLPEYLTKRFFVSSKALQIISAAVFLVAYTVYAASSIKACGILFNTITGISALSAMKVATCIIASYTFVGGFLAVSWIDFFQGVLMLLSILSVPIFSALSLKLSAPSTLPSGYLTLFTNWKEVVSGLSWGLGYFGMPHIIVKFMALKSAAELNKSAKISIVWSIVIVTFATLIGILGRLLLGFNTAISANSLVFIVMVRKLFLGVVSGVLLSAVLAASMSSADNQLLTAASAFANDVYKAAVRQNSATHKEVLWCGRLVVIAVSLAALAIASHPSSGSIMSLVKHAWGVFGAAFGPVMLLSLYYKRLTFLGAAFSIVSGALVDIGWGLYLSASSGIYELLPGFVAGLLSAVIVSLIDKKPDIRVQQLFTKAR